jgi:fermentation-respiration switch protein FrsA (DUF1100 family)
VTIVFVALLGVFALLSLVWWSQERILFQPPRLYDATVQAGRIDYSTTDGQHLIGYLVGDTATAKGVLLCFHGNADLAVWQLTWAQAVSDRTGFAVMLAEYRGYMSLGGKPTYATAKLDALAAYTYLTTDLRVEVERLAYFGHSLGSAVAAELAEVHKPRVLLLQSPFTSALAMATLILTAPIARFWKVASRIHFDTRRIVAGLDIPVAVAHGKRDRIVPFRMGMEVYNAVRIKGPLLVVDGAGHNDIPAVAGVRYWSWVSVALSAGT